MDSRPAAAAEDPGADVVRLHTRLGEMLAFREDQFITPCLRRHGELSPGEIALLLQLVKPGDTVVEAGANIGVHTLALARGCAPGPLHAFEPQQRVFQVMCANLALNGVGNVLAWPHACGETRGELIAPVLDFSRRANFGGVALASADADPARPGVRVPCVPIDDLELAECHLIKVDVEGHEAAVLRGAARTIARCRPRLYLENEMLEPQAELIGLVAGLGYDLWWHLPRLEPDDPPGGSAFGQGFVSLNMLAMPRERPVDVQGGVRIDPENWTDPMGRQAFRNGRIERLL